MMFSVIKLFKNDLQKHKILYIICMCMCTVQDIGSNVSLPKKHGFRDFLANAQRYVHLAIRNRFYIEFQKIVYNLNCMYVWWSV